MAFVIFIAYPEDDPSLPTEILHYEESGTTARLECAIKPGVLTTEYFVTWKNASSGVNLINLVKGSLQSQYRTDTRYTVAQNDFSLLIEDVKPSDAGMYLCVLGVSGAQRFSVPEEYDQTKRINLTLQVFGRCINIVLFVQSSALLVQYTHCNELSGYYHSLS